MLKRNKKEKTTAIINKKELKIRKEKEPKVKKEKKPRKKHIMGPIEFLFNFISLVFVLAVALYYGGRSLYYYSKQNVKIKQEAMTVNGLVVQNNDITNGNSDGLHQDNDGYYFKGNVTNNYVMFENKLFRIIRVNNDSTVKMISEGFVSSFMWGENSNYKDSNIQNWLNKTDKEHSGIYYNTISNIEKVLAKTEYSEDILYDGKIMTLEEYNKEKEEEKKKLEEEQKKLEEEKEKKEEVKEEKKEEKKEDTSKKKTTKKKTTKKKTETKDETETSENKEEVKKEKDYVTILTVKDYTLANGMSSYLNNGKMFFLLGLNEENENLYVEEDGSIQSTDSLAGYGIRPVITLKKNTEVVSGSGTKEDPYIIKSNEVNYVDSYVKLGDDTWKVSSVEGDTLRLYLNGYLKSGGQEVVRNYSSYNSIYNLGDWSNIGNYLNNGYVNSLPYQGVLTNCNFYTGEISDDAGYNFTNIYNRVDTARVGLLNIFDYVSNNELSDYFHINLTSEIGSMEYNTYSSGLLEEADVRDVKHIVPVVCIKKDSIKNGEGKIDNPYKVE